MHPIHRVLLLISGFLLFIPACTSFNYPESPSLYTDQVQMLNGHLQSQPDDMEAVGELGIIYAKTARHDRAQPLLDRVYADAPDDPRIAFYYGMNLEYSGRIDEAMTVYLRYREFSSRSPFRHLMDGRYRWLIREQIKTDIDALLDRETALDPSGLSTQRIAVFPFMAADEDRRYNDLGVGLAEMVITDLSQVQAIEVVERVRIQTLISEMALPETGLVDAETAPRYGLILGSGRIVHGRYAVLADDVFRVDAAYWNLAAGQIAESERVEGALADLFALEKDLVFNLLASMNVEPTPVERARIQQLPTQNLQAFLAYSRALVAEDQGRFGVALRLYQAAKVTDPNFKAAADGADRAEDALEWGGSRDAVLERAIDIESPIPEPTVDILDERLQNLGEGIDSGFLPGPENKDATEGDGGLIQETAPLRDPPPPPPPPPPLP